MFAPIFLVEHLHFQLIIVGCLVQRCCGLKIWKGACLKDGDKVCLKRLNSTPSCPNYIHWRDWFCCSKSVLVSKPKPKQKPLFKQDDNENFLAETAADMRESKNTPTFTSGLFSPLPLKPACFPSLCTVHQLCPVRWAGVGCVPHTSVQCTHRSPNLPDLAVFLGPDWQVAEDSWGFNLQFAFCS